MIILIMTLTPTLKDCNHDHAAGGGTGSGTGDPAGPGWLGPRGVGSEPLAACGGALAVSSISNTLGHSFPVTHSLSRSASPRPATPRQHSRPHGDPVSSAAASMDGIRQYEYRHHRQE
eukprot:1119474-Rhodomonas_salina.1